MEGCAYDLSNGATDDFVPGVFKLRVDNVRNPRDEVDTEPFIFEVYE